MWTASASWEEDQLAHGGSRAPGPSGAIRRTNARIPNYQELGLALRRRRLRCRRERRGRVVTGDDDPRGGRHAAHESLVCAGNGAIHAATSERLAAVLLRGSV